MVYTVSKKIKLYDAGDCVEVTAWEHFGMPPTIRGLLQNKTQIGLVLEAELVIMDVKNGSGLLDVEEWMYRVSLSNGSIVEAWNYEIRPVNVMGKEYNSISHQPEGE